MSERASWPRPGEDPQHLDPGALLPLIRRALEAPELQSTAYRVATLRDVAELLATTVSDAPTHSQRAPFQCFHCGAVLETRRAQQIHFGRTPTMIPVCLAPAAARRLLECARRVESATRGAADADALRRDLSALCLEIDRTCAQESAAAPRSGKDMSP